MKQLITAILLTFISVYGNAGNVTKNDIANFKQSIISVVKSEGFSPDIDSDGDISLKYQGETYWITVEPFDDNYYVSLWTYMNIEGNDINEVLRAADATMHDLKFLRMYTVTRYIKIKCDWYCVTISDFKNMFMNALIAVSYGESKFMKKLKD